MIWHRCDLKLPGLGAGQPVADGKRPPMTRRAQSSSVLGMRRNGSVSSANLTVVGAVLL